MARTPRYLPAALAGLVIVAGAGLVLDRASGGYTVQVSMASATNVVPGGPVLVDGFESGRVSDIEVVDGRAVVTMELDEEIAPLHDGAEVVVDWKAALSERQIQITDGGDAEIPDGGMITGASQQAIEIDDVLAALDAPTRAGLQSLIKRLEPTLKGNEKDLRETVASGGPAIEALGQVLQALGTDGPAIRSLVTRLDSMLTVVAERDQEVSEIVEQLGDLTRDVATRRSAVRETLTRLPATLDQADETLRLVPSVVDEAVPLLESLEPATAKLGPVAANLRPVLQDLRPLTADLRPMLAFSEELLALTPGLLDQTDRALPGTDQAIQSLVDPVAFLRPYTPEIAGFFSTWGSSFANYDYNGNFARIHGQEGPTSVNENPGVLPPGVTYEPYPQPGQVVGQSWTDAYGSEMR